MRRELVTDGPTTIQTSRNGHTYPAATSYCEEDPQYTHLQRGSATWERPATVERNEIRGKQRDCDRRGDLVGREVADAIFVGELPNNAVGDADHRATEPRDRPGTPDAVACHGASHATGQRYRGGGGHHERTPRAALVARYDRGDPARRR